MYCLGVLKLLPLQGDNLASITTQGAALGYELLGLQPVLEPHAKVQSVIKTKTRSFDLNKS